MSASSGEPDGVAPASLPGREWVRRAAAALLGAYLRLAIATTRWRIEGEAELRHVAAPGGTVVAFWHECLPSVPGLWRRVQRMAPGRRATILVSRHRDGQFVAGVMAGFGLDALHGSRARPGRKRDKGGAAALRAMRDALDAGEIVAITPDGPRGPRRVAAGGATYLAARAGIGVVPVAARTRWHIRLPSWDRMEVPLPFGTGTAICLPAIAPEAPLGPALDMAMARVDALLARPPLAARIWAALASFAIPFLQLALRQRARRGREIADRLPERAGIDATPRPAGRLLWLHAASIGECVSILPVLTELPADITVLFTTGTVTSARLLEQRLPALDTAGRVRHRFAPLDVPAWASRFLDHWRPDAAGFLESEIWPNQLAALRARNIPVALLNARLSSRSAARWGWVRGFARHLLRSYAWIAAQSSADAARFARLGAPRVSAPGNLKAAAPALPADPAELARLAALLADRPRFLAASTHPGEEAMVARVHAALAPEFPGLLTAIVPRHPARGPAVAAELDAPRRAAGADPGAGLWIADTLGELGLFYRLFDIVLMGKSFAGGGGQNPLEPARFGCAIATGPATANFADTVAALRAAGAIAVLADEAAITGWVAAMLRDPAGRARAGAAARGVAEAGSALPRVLAAQLVAMMGA